MSAMDAVSVKWFKPTGDRMLVRVDVPKTMSAGGIHLPSHREQPSLTGTVLEVGPGKLLENGTRAPMSAKVGDRIMFIRMFNAPELGVQVGDENLMIMMDGNILGIVDPLPEEPKLAIAAE